MIIPVRCHSCGMPIAHLWQEYKERTEKKGEEKRKVLDALGIDRYCCRAAFLGQKDLIDISSRFKKW